jgi:hypothetical protein
VRVRGARKGSPDICFAAAGTAQLHLSSIVGSDMHRSTWLALCGLVATFALGCSKSTDVTRPHSASRDPATAGLVSEDPLAAASQGGAASPVPGDNLTPTVQIESPLPSPLLAALVAPGVRVRISGVDPDGHPDRPVEYRWLLLLATTYDDEREIFTYLIDPDSLRRKHTWLRGLERAAGK